MTVTSHASTLVDTFMQTYLPPTQRRTVEILLKGEEGEFFEQTLAHLADVVHHMPRVLPSNLQSMDDAVAYLHYFYGGCDWYILEPADNDRVCFCYANLGDDQNAEYGSLWLGEFDSLNVELDFHWTPKTMREVLAQRQGQSGGFGASGASALAVVDPITPLRELSGPSDDNAQPREQIIALNDFIRQFGDGLLQQVQAQNPPVYLGRDRPDWDAVLDGLLRQPFEAQRDVVHATATLLLEQGEPGAIINGEMGTGKTLMGIALAALLHKQGYPRTLVVSPPHLVYKWRREIIQTVPNARVWILNGPDTLRKLLQIRSMRVKPVNPEFFILGRVRMRMGFDWKPAYVTRVWGSSGLESGQPQVMRVAACSDCGSIVHDDDNQVLQAGTEMAETYLNKRRLSCKSCGGRLWTLTRGKASDKTQRERVLDALRQIPGIGDVTASRLVKNFGEAMLASMLEDNFHNFINLMDDDGELLFNDRQAKRMERFLGNNEISFGQGGYQPTEFVKRYLPKGFFGCILVDEGHEYKNEGSAQGQAMGVLAACCSKTVLLTGTLMGGYADDLFHLLFRLNPRMMVEDGFCYNERGSIGPASNAFMAEHGVLIETRKEMDEGSHRTAKGNRDKVSVSKGPGFGPKGIMRYVVPYTAFLKLKDIGGNVLPPYKEEFIAVPMDELQAQTYQRRLASPLQQLLRDALRAGDHSLMGVVLNVLLAWPDCAFRDENVYHPHKRALLACAPVLYSDADLMPKERELLQQCRDERSRGRRVLVYTTYTGGRDTTARLKAILEQSGFKVAVLRSTVEAAKREDWLADQVERGVEIIITNPELVKTGLDMLEFPTIVFMQTGYNVYTLLQAARRSWRIGQKMPVRVLFLGYQGTAQEQCLTLMSKKIVVAQSTSGDMPETGLDVLNQDGDSIEVALAKQLVAA